MSILVTRPSPAGEKLVEKLRAYGKLAWHLPLIRFLPGMDLPMLGRHFMALCQDDLLFILSQHAIVYAHSWLLQQSINWPARLRYFTVGSTSGLLLHQFSGLPVNYPHQCETSEGLLNLPSLASIDGRRALILRGNGGRKILKQTLLQRGVKVEDCECYRRYPIPYDGNEQGRRLLSLGINTLVITSGEMLQQFYTLIPKSYHYFLLIQCRLIVVSERLAILAHKLGWQDIIIVNITDHDALMRVLR
ncbi:uroporphyrinogen-III synthase [Candidatus Palibaumannia cicadellinicola]|uniref:Uroporphyrinogen-III synthase n=1 Tax=Baumannia cicadellinicola subsp. Homalodisca coagulata TaxID=374463 RepID=Q1LU24_BAUCH|nr:uroporphyrinogen-III synthase [Candidatus Baumannia cicadellinicola]ABF14120.1 uroporphyrinogen-III synthase [Baumannia cicadellinicola str. Hc (Homalodisca coagulata)]MBS0032600.1 uroporphyrinogen-III synthase [Candidatus Baumannia cicadellinicola]MCJ7462488.1 uroporphyrinogen-III synthase [Candidatus Baumannia cicadellinicola]MCJ7462943.1 uroporphyrinogen-III synthase [Candidatus Baumannia cicadellinicola]